MALPESGRRRFLQSSLGITAAAALGTTGLHTAVATPAQAGTTLPPVPGMLGDRRANEVWYRLDEVTLYDQPPELKDAYAALGATIGATWQRAIVLTWLDVLESGDYPRDFTAYVAAVRQPLQVLSRIQLDVFDAFYRPRSPRLTSAFSWFGQGVLYDPRRQEAHTMNGDPPMGYRAWHVFSRAMMFLDIDRSRWRTMIPLNAFASAVQLEAKPDMYAVNPPLPRETVSRLAASWLPRSPRRLDDDFRVFPSPAPQAARPGTT